MVLALMIIPITNADAISDPTDRVGVVFNNSERKGDTKTFPVEAMRILEHLNKRGFPIA